MTEQRLDTWHAKEFDGASPSTEWHGGVLAVRGERQTLLGLLPLAAAHVDALVEEGAHDEVRA